MSDHLDKAADAAMLAKLDAPAAPSAQQQPKDAVQQGKGAWKGYQAAATAGLAAQIVDGPAPPLHKRGRLGLLGTEKSQRYTRLMRDAVAAAREVDQERGYGEDGPAAVLESFAEAAELDVFGAVGVVRE